MQANMIVFSDFSGVDETGFPTFGPGLIAPNGQAILAGQYGAEFEGVGIPINAYNPIGLLGPADFFEVNFDGHSNVEPHQFAHAPQHIAIVLPAEPDRTSVCEGKSGAEP